MPQGTRRDQNNSVRKGHILNGLRHPLLLILLLIETRTDAAPPLQNHHRPTCMYVFYSRNQAGRSSELKILDHTNKAEPRSQETINWTLHSSHT